MKKKKRQGNKAEHEHVNCQVIIAVQDTVIKDTTYQVDRKARKPTVTRSVLGSKTFLATKLFLKRLYKSVIVEKSSWGPVFPPEYYYTHP